MEKWLLLAILLLLGLDGWVRYDDPPKTYKEQFMYDCSFHKPHFECDYMWRTMTK